jgi:autotransporter-associated beta strand protein
MARLGLILPAAFATLLSPAAAPATAQTWSGSVSGSWSNGLNWSPNGVPTSSQNTSLTFGATSHPSMSDDIAGTFVFNQLTFSSGDPAYTLSGNPISAATSGGNNPAAITINSSNSVTINNAIGLATGLTVSGVAGGNLTLNGVVSGAGSLTYFGGGTLNLANTSNSFGGGLTILGGTLVTAFGTGWGPLAFDGGAWSYNGPSTEFGVPITLAAHGATIAIGTGTTLLLGQISGPGGLTKTGNGTMFLDIANSSNPFSGGVTISAGTLWARNLGALGTGPWTFDGGTLYYTGDSTATATPISLTPNGGTITVGAGTTLTVNTAAGGPGGLTKSGPGTLILAGMNTNSGPNSITEGAMVVSNGASLGTGATNIAGGILTVAAGGSFGAGAVTVGPAGTLTGNGTVTGHTEVAGTIAPGSGATGTLTFTAPMVWDPGAKYSFGLSATTNLNPGVNYTTINSSSTLDLSSLSHANPFIIAVSGYGQILSTPVTYTLATFNIGGPSGGITGFNPAYFAFTGNVLGSPTVNLDSTQNQLLLTFPPVVPATTPIWSGSANGSWSNPSNWSVAVTANNTDLQLAFGTTPNPVMTNDLTGTLVLNQLGFYAGSPIYTLTGNGLDFRTNRAGGLPSIVSYSANVANIQSTVTLTNSVTVSGTGAVSLTGAIDGAGGLVKSGTGTLTLVNSSNSFTGGVLIQDGVLAVSSDSSLGAGPVTFGSPVVYLSYLSTTSSGRQFTLGGASLTVANGATLTFGGNTIDSGYLNGPGAIATDAASGARFINVIARPSLGMTSNSGLDLFQNFTNGGLLSVTANIPSATPVTLNSFANQGSGSITIGANSRVNAADFQSYGTLTLTPGTGTGQTAFTNVGASPLYFNGGSRTFLGTTQSNAASTRLELNGQNAIVAGGLFVNNGQVTDNSATGTATIIVDYGAFLKGAGTYQNSVKTQNGGRFQAGNSPGAATLGNFVFGPGGVNNYVFAIDNAIGQAGPVPDANNQVSGWGLVKTGIWARRTGVTSGDFAWTADASIKVTVALDTLVNPTTAGTDIPGLMANFDPTRAYSWPAVQWAGAYSGPTDATALDAATVFDTSTFANPVAGTFGWRLDAAGQTLSLTYTPSAVPEPGTLALTGLVAVAGVRVRRRWLKNGCQSDAFAARFFCSPS